MSFQWMVEWFCRSWQIQIRRVTLNVQYFSLLFATSWEGYGIIIHLNICYYVLSSTCLILMYWFSLSITLSSYIWTCQPATQTILGKFQCLNDQYHLKTTKHYIQKYQTLDEINITSFHNTNVYTVISADLLQ